MVPSQVLVKGFIYLQFIKLLNGSVVVESIDSKAMLPGFESWLCDSSTDSSQIPDD